MASTPVNNHTNSNLKSLQILRAIAAVSVIYYHIGTPHAFGSFGVDIFFTLSGFVMALVISNGQSPYVFAVSRLARIVPLYWILTTGILLLAVIKPDLLNSTTANLTNYLKSLFFIPYVKENGLLQPLLGVGWTLNYEMFFYFCIWLAIITSRKYYLFVTLLLLTFAYAWLGTRTDSPAAAEFFGSAMLFEFSLGIFAFEIYKRNALPHINKNLLVAVAFASYVAMVAAATSSLEIPRILKYGIPSTLLLLSFTQLEEHLFGNNNSFTRLLTTIGDGSYATYLSHIYVVEGVKRVVLPNLPLGNGSAATFVALTLMAALLVGHIIYTLLDKPINKVFRNKLLAAKPTPLNPLLSKHNAKQYN